CASNFSRHLKQSTPQPGDEVVYGLDVAGGGGLRALAELIWPKRPKRCRVTGHVERLGLQPVGQNRSCALDRLRRGFEGLQDFAACLRIGDANRGHRLPRDKLTAAATGYGGAIGKVVFAPRTDCRTVGGRRRTPWDSGHGMETAVQGSCAS